VAAKTNVFLVHGRNDAARVATTLYLRALGLTPLDFDEVRNSIGGSPFVGEVINKGLAAAAAVVVLMTPDEYSVLRPEYRQQNDPVEDIKRFQPRANVLIEAGMALAIAPEKTILVVFGDVAVASDLRGRHFLRISNDAQSRARLKNALTAAGCEVHESNDIFSPTIAGDFDTALTSLVPNRPIDPFRRSG
jgi:predicted nucleotide-binding protein